VLDPSLSVHPLFASHRRDSSVEIEERYERVVSASLRALSSMVDVFAQQQAVLLRASGTSEAAVSPKVDTGSTPGKQQQQQQQQHRRDITSVVLGCTALAAAAAAAAAQQQQKNHSNGVGEQLPKWTSTCTVGADSKNAFDRAPTP
jgi:hypothetical protein